MRVNLRKKEVLIDLGKNLKHFELVDFIQDSVFRVMNLGMRAGIHRFELDSSLLSNFLVGKANFVDFEGKFPILTSSEWKKFYSLPKSRYFYIHDTHMSQITAPRFHVIT